MHFFTFLLKIIPIYSNAHPIILSYNIGAVFPLYPYNIRIISAQAISATANQRICASISYYDAKAIMTWKTRQGKERRATRRKTQSSEQEPAKKKSLPNEHSIERRIAMRQMQRSDTSRCASSTQIQAGPGRDKSMQRSDTSRCASSASIQVDAQVLLRYRWDRAETSRSKD